MLDMATFYVLSYLNLIESISFNLYVKGLKFLEINRPQGSLKIKAG